jgi:glycosyltransferase involved in cell wall biosynthesis
MIMKTTQITKEERLLNIPVTLPGGGKAPTFFDSRDYSLDELTDLYKFAHAFVFPTMGEGWGLTLHEAMATGLPAIYTPYSAPADWVPRKYAYPVRFKMQKIETHKNLKNGGIVKHHTTEAASAYIGDIVQKMRRIYTRYDEALDKGRKASQRVRRITWDASAASFIEKIAPYSEARDGEESLPSTGSARRVYA